MNTYFMRELAQMANAKLKGRDDLQVQHLLYDSRNVFSPVDSLFIAIAGDRQDGHQFIDILYQRGVRCFLISKWQDSFDNMKDASFLICKNAIIALHEIATHHRKRFNYPVVAITGSNGKTVVKEWIFQSLNGISRIVRSPKSYNSQIGVPLSVWQMNENYDVAVFEAGISHVNEMHKLESIIRPEIGIFTNIGDAHQEHFNSLEQKVQEKLLLFKNVEKLVFCNDHHLIRDAVNRQTEVKTFTWAQHTNADVVVLSVNRLPEQTHISYLYHNLSSDFTIPFSDLASFENAMHVLCLLLLLDVPRSVISERLRQLSSVGMRLEMKTGINNCTIINDSYNSDLGSLSIALDFLAQQNQHKKRSIILSDLLQTGRDEAALYNDVSELLKLGCVNTIYGIGTALMRNKDKFNMEKFFFVSTDDFLKHIDRERFRNESILIKGARNFEFERISKTFEEKQHRTVLEINLNAIVFNLNYFRTLLKPETKVLVMVKALSYGCGTYEISNVLQHQRVDYLGVAFTDEGIALRRSGINLPILVMNPESGTFDNMIDNNLEPEIFDLSNLLLLDNVLQQKNKKNYPVHLKFDTGMHRLGFSNDELLVLLDHLTTLKTIKVCSVFSHLAAADESQHDSFTLSQIQLFDEMSSRLISKLGYSVIRHICNSSGTERFKEAHYDMVRLGIGLYGISALNQLNVQNISSLKSYVAQIRNLDQSETVGYGRKGRLSRPTRIAIVPVGYADGLDRRLSNCKGSLFVSDIPAPIVGNICMDMCMIDITDIHGVVLGDMVEIFGINQSVTNLADTLETIPYEILTGISQRVKRVYFHE